MSQLTSALDFTHIKNSQYLDDTYLTLFEKVMREDLCPSQTLFPKIDGDYPGCRAFISGMAYQGLNIILINYTKSLRLLISQYKELLAETNKNYTYVRSVFLNSKDLYDIT